MGARISIDDLPPHLQRQARAQLLGKPETAAQPIAPAPTAVPDKMIRQHKGDGMNRWEREYLAVLDVKWSHIYREVSLPLANGVKYKVDFLCVSTANNSIVVAGYEVKGQRRSTGIVKIKMAARLYPWIMFTLATKRRKKDGGGWSEQGVLP